jgi:hypothetical protein
MGSPFDVLAKQPVFEYGVTERSSFEPFANVFSGLLLRIF